MTPFDTSSPAAHPRPSYGGFLLLGVTLMIVIACVFSLFASLRLQTLLMSHTSAPSPTVPLATLPRLDIGRSTLSSIAMVSTDDGWIVGENSSYALILHYQSGHWLPEPVTVARSWLQAVAFADTQHGWAVGFRPLDGPPLTVSPSDGSPSTEALVLHYQQGHWSRVIPPLAITGTLTKIHLVSANEWWALNNHGESSSFALVHYNRGVWSLLSLPPQVTDAHGLTVAGPDDVWVGMAGGLMRMHGKALEQSVQDIKANLLALDLHTPQNGWAVGFTFCGKSSLASPTCDQSVAIYHYDGAIWDPVTIDARGILDAIAMLSGDDVWAAGTTMSKEQSGSLLLHYQHGVWHQYTSTFPIDITALSMTDSTEGWAIGYSRVADGTGNAPGLLHYHNGVWTQVTLA